MGKVACRSGWRIAVLSVVFATALAAGAAQAQATAVQEFYTGLSITAFPGQIVAGPEGGLWFTAHNPARIDRFTPEGILSEVFIAPGSNPQGITVGPEGNLWFTEPGHERVGRITPAGAVTEFASDGITGEPEGITTGPEGNLWFTESSGTIGRITPAGFVTEFSAGITGSGLYGITPGPEGNLWFTEGSKIGRITPAGAVTEFSTGITPGSEPHDIALGPDGNLWFTERAGGRIGRITPEGVVTEFSSGISPGAEPQEIIAGPRGSLWFTERAGGRIARITPEGVVSEFSAGITPGSEPAGIAAGADSSLWFTEETGQIAQATLLGAPAPTVVTGAATSVTRTAAALHATVDPNGSSVSDCHFEYGSSEAYGSSAPCSSLPGAGSRAVAVVASVGALREGTTYHFRIVSTSGGGTSYGDDQTFTTSSAPSPPSTGMWVGVDVGGWPSSVAGDVAGAVSYVRLDTAGSIAGWTAAGLKVINDISGPYSSNGVSSINASQWAANAVAWYDANPECAAIEVLNEPGNSGFWGPNAGDQENATAYAHLLKVVHEAFVANGRSPKILASYDGGEGPTTWGEEVFSADPNMGSYIDGITMHSYGGTQNRAASALGSRYHIEAAHAQHPDIPIYVTEVGWPTAVGEPPTGDSLQWTEAEQAANIFGFVTWAWSTGYIADVTIFNYRDYGSNDWYGIESASGAHKLGYQALHEAATELPLSLEPLPSVE